MPLVSSTLEAEIVKIIDKDDTTFQGFPSDNVEVAQRWSDAVNAYALSVAPPSVNATTATGLMETALLPINSNTPTGLTTFCAGILAYATSLGLGMQPTFTATPPPAPLEPLLTPVMASGFAGASASVIATQMATIIDGWYKTGIAVNNSTSVSVPWS